MRARSPRSPGPLRRSGIALVALLVALTGMFAIAGPGAQAETPATPLADPGSGTATWGLRTSFRNYIAGPIAHGTIEASAGAVWLPGAGNGKGPFTFPVTSAAFDPTQVQGEVALGGSVYLGGHDYGEGYVLELTLSDLKLDISGSAGTLHADLAYRPFVSANPEVPPAPLQTAQDVAFATVDLSGVTWTADGTGAYTITDAPAVGVASTMQMIGWDAFYSLEYPTVVLDPLTLSFKPGGFSDVAPGTLFHAAITWMADQGITTGYDDGTFRPVAPVTRQSMAAFLYRYADPGPVAPGGPTFSDVAPGHLFYDAITWMASEGIATGYLDGTFRPNDVLSRQAVAAFLYRYADPGPVAPGGPTFSDVAPGSLFYDPITWMAGQGITTGYQDGTFRPNDVITRQSAAAFLYRYDQSLLPI